VVVNTQDIGSELHPYRNFHTYGLRLH
jgi:hypothetical protein